MDAGFNIETGAAASAWKDALTRISITEVGKCQKVAYYRALGVPPAPKHFVPLRGIILHSRIEEYLTDLKAGREPSREWDIEAVVERYGVPLHARGSFIETLANGWKNFLQFMDGFIWTFEAVEEVETKIEDTLGEFTIVGRPDLVTGSTIYDFKSGKKPRYIPKDYRIQLLGYKALLGEHYKIKLVYLGGAVPEVVEVKGDVGEFYEALKETIVERVLMINGTEPSAKFGFMCSMCDFRHVCRGV